MPRVIPVLDLRRGRVVRAVRGERERYAPVRSTLVRGSEPRQVLAALLRLAPFGAVYLADLDAIQGGAPQRRLLAALCRAHPRTEFWIDAGPPPDWPLHVAKTFLQSSPLRVGGFPPINSSSSSLISSPSLCR